MFYFTLLINPNICRFRFVSQNATVTQDRSTDAWTDISHPSIVSAQINQPPPVVDEYILPMKRDPLFLEREPLIDHNIHRSGVSLYGRDPALSTLRTSGIHGGGPGGPLLSQVWLILGFTCIFIFFF